MFTDRIPWAGRVRIVVERRGRLDVVWLDNLIVDSGKALLADALRNDAPQTEILYMAWGANATAPDAGDTTLIQETGRKAITGQAQGGEPYEIITTTYLGPNDANGQIEELGWFAGDATATKDSGTLIARVLYSKLKDNLESIQVDRTDTVG